uniref:Clusterin n=1 Tax=Serinus canaria TaxID=9135 RepID=A0A8C9MT85_SERCA
MLCQGSVWPWEQGLLSWGWLYSRNRGCPVGIGVLWESGNAVLEIAVSWESGNAMLGIGVSWESGNAVPGIGVSLCSGNAVWDWAVQLARQKEQELSARGERCNASVQALWESCKPCLRQRCLRFYSRTCRSGAGLVGRQLEEFLNHSSPISIWVDGERLDSLLERDERQERQLQELEERFGLLEDGVQDIFRDSSRVQGRLHPFFQAPFGGFREAPAVQRLRLPRRFRRFSGDFFPFFPQRRGGFQQLFQPLFQITQRMLEDAQGGWENPSGEFGTESRNFSNDRMVCREIRRNSAGCLRMRDECEQCREILEEMLNTSGLLDQLNRQFGWVSRLANHSMGSDGFLQVTTVRPDPSAPPDTQVTVQLFDSEPLALTVPGDVPWDHPRFMEIVAQQALQHFKENGQEEG